MPYISKNDRHHFDDLVHAISGTEISGEGNLNYLITALCNKYLKEKTVRYGTINTVVGVLECAKLEFYRRLAAPYEDNKIIENGDVY